MEESVCFDRWRTWRDSVDLPWPPAYLWVTWLSRDLWPLSLCNIIRIYHTDFRTNYLHVLLWIRDTLGNIIHQMHPIFTGSLFTIFTAYSCPGCTITRKVLEPSRRNYALNLPISPANYNFSCWRVQRISYFVVLDHVTVMLLWSPCLWSCDHSSDHVTVTWPTSDHVTLALTPSLYHVTVTWLPAGIRQGGFSGVHQGPCQGWQRLGPSANGDYQTTFSLH